MSTRGYSRPINVPSDLAEMLDRAAAFGPAMTISAMPNAVLPLWFLKLRTFNEMPEIKKRPRNIQKVFYFSPQVWQQVGIIAELTGESKAAVVIEGLYEGLRLSDSLDLEHIRRMIPEDRQLQLELVWQGGSTME